MALTKTHDGWLLDVKPGGRKGRRIRKTFPTKAEAMAYERYALAQIDQNKEWRPGFRDSSKPLSELIGLWFSSHGHQLKSGTGTCDRLLALSKAMGEPRGAEITPEKFAEYRQSRMNSGSSQATMNRELSLIKAVFEELRRLKIWQRPNPLADVKKAREQNAELFWLSLSQISDLLAACAESENPHLALGTEFALQTGARWGEVENLITTQITKGCVMIGTKSGGPRAIPISDELEIQLRDHHKENGSGSNVFGYCRAAFAEAIKRAKIELPRGQMTHVIRHTFASHFLQAGGDLLTLKNLLGHSSLTVTMRYAHLAPGQLQQAIKFNPIALLTAK